MFIGLRPKVSAVLQPIAQVAASVPATALFPVLLLVLIRMGGGLGIGSIAAAVAGHAVVHPVQCDRRGVGDSYRLERGLLTYSASARCERWRKLLLPGIFPYLITGFVTASGGAWNASIVAEYFHFKGQTLSTVGLGAVISQATDSGNFARTAGGNDGDGRHGRDHQSSGLA